MAGGQEAVQHWSAGVSPSVPLRSVFGPLQAHEPLRLFVCFVCFLQANEWIHPKRLCECSVLSSFLSVSRR